MKIYSVLVEYTNFEDEDNNYSEIRGIYTTKEKALERIKFVLEENLDMGMVYKGNSFKPEDYKEEIEQDGYLLLEQDYGYGESRIILDERDINQEDEFQKLIEKKKKYCDALTKLGLAFKELDALTWEGESFNELLDNDDYPFTDSFDDVNNLVQNWVSINKKKLGGK